jgi:hypothetical protein
VNGKDGCFVKFNQRSVDQINGCPMIRLGFEQIPQQIVLAGSGTKCFFGLQQFGPNPISQLLSGRYGKGYHQDLINPELLFQNQPYKQSLDGVSFASTGTGFNQIDALKGGVYQVKRFQII